MYFEIELPHLKSGAVSQPVHDSFPLALVLRSLGTLGTLGTLVTYCGHVDAQCIEFRLRSNCSSNF